MMNVMDINGYQAVIAYDPEIEMFRGEFVGLNGSADFYSKDVPGLHVEGEKSLEIFLQMCQEQRIQPTKEFSGSILLNLSKGTHKAVVTAAEAAGKSLDQWATEAFEQVMHI